MTVEKLITDHIDIWSSALQTRSTAGRGNNSKIDLYGIKKLRELILELAVRGKLVPQDPNDEPASELLKRIAAEKAELVKQGKIKKQKPLLEISEDEKPFELPEGWEWVHLPDIYCSISESSRKIKSSEILPEGKYPVIEQSHEFISGYCNNECLLIKLNKPVIVFGDHTRNIKFIDFDFVVGADGVKILSPILICERFFFWQLRSFKLDVRGYARHFKVLNSRLFALPPIAEQERIVEKVCSLMSLCDQLEQQSLTSLDAHQQLVETLLATLTDSQNAEELAENWARISQHFDTLFTTEASIDALKQTILQLAVMGKLVPQDPNDEPASELLKRIEQEKAQQIKEGKIKKKKSFVKKNDGKKYELPNGWVQCHLGDIVTISSGDGLTSKQMAVDGNIPVYGGNGITGYHDNWNVDKPTIVIGRVGYYCGSVHITPSLAWVTDNAFITYYSKNNVDTCFLSLLLKGTNLKENENATAQPVISGSKIYPIVIMLPPLNEQKKIVKKFFELNCLCDTLKSRLQSAQRTQLNLADALTDAALN
ncbi:restriction endonuclease subunit S [Escherichia coli]|nr:restriction endonuclease subunit S [Escherichia coli]MXH04636.1 restriction endonuclease subunit S [Escherichia coli]